jgi:Flp pilus assembly protein TadD/mono/diheme cytochrome c family protein
LDVVGTKELAGTRPTQAKRRTLQGLIGVWLALPLTAGTVTFDKDVAPILYQSCAPCHRAGEAGPFPLLTYADARKRASQLVAVTARRYMPPWPPEPGYGDFADSRRLTDQQIRTIAEWVQQGEPEGNAADLPRAPQFVEGWQLGQPDLVVRMPVPFTLPASGTDVFRNFVIPLNLTGTRYIRAIELRPGNKRIVHHANIVIDHGRTLRAQDGVDGQPGFPGMDVITQSVGEFDPDSHFLFWKPGTAPHEEPPDMSLRLDPDTDLIFNLHLQPSGKPEQVQPSVGIYFASQPPTRFPMLVQLEHDGDLDIPPGAAKFTVTDHLILPVDAQVLGIYPHAHYLGKRIAAWATLPDGTRRWLIRINDWDINWQAVYTFRQPIDLPKGTRLEMRIEYDNSGRNPRNPNHPPKRVRGGNRSEDEMGHVWLQLLPSQAGGDGRMALQEAVMRRRLEKYPADFVAHYNLGALMLTRDQPAAAIPFFEAALKVKPADVTARNSLSAALIADNRLDEAVRELRQILQTDSRSPMPHFNLARALALQGELAGAAAEYKVYLEHQPDDADAYVNLARIYIQQRDYAAAVPNLREAARLRPGDGDVQTNLGAALAMLGQTGPAVEAFERAVALDPGNQTAQSNLAAAKAELAKHKN